MLEIIIQEVLWSIRGSYSAIWSIPLKNVKWHSDPWPTVASQPIRLSTNFTTFIPSLTITDYEWFPWSICNGCGMPAGNAYHSGHLVPSPFWGLACALIVETSFPDSSPIKWPTEVDFYRIERFPWSICDRCGMPAGSAYPSGHMVPSPIVGLACAQIVETRFLELVMSLLDFSPRIPLGTF